MNRLSHRFLIASFMTFALMQLIGMGCATTGGGIDPREWKWAVSEGRKSLSAGHALCIAEDGDLYVVGATTDTITIGGTEIRANASFTSFIVRYPEGSPKHPRVLASFGARSGDKGHAAPYRVAVDRDENVYMTGQFGGTVFIGGKVLSSKQEHYASFVAKYDSSGRAVWGIPIVPESEFVRSLAVTRDGDCYFGLHAKGTVVIGDTTCHFTERRALLVSLRRDGTVRWIKVFGGEKSSYFMNVAVDRDGNPLVWWGRELRPEVRSPGGGWAGAYYALLLESYTPEGGARWTSPVGWAGDVSTGRIYFDRDAILLQGSYSPDSTHGLRWLSAHSGNVLSRFDGSGRGEWAVSIGPGDEYFRGGGVDDDGNYYFVSSYEKISKYFPGVPDSVVASLFPTTVGYRDLMIICRNARTGAFRWIWTTGGPGDEPLIDAVVDRDGGVYLTGWYAYRARFGTIELEASGGNDYYVAKLGRKE